MLRCVNVHMCVRAHIHRFLVVCFFYGENDLSYSKVVDFRPGFTISKFKGAFSLS